MAFKRLIEVALPVREISAESVRDKSLRHGHISTLHLWWARRPLAAARGIVFASLVPDPEDPGCPEEFSAVAAKLLRDAVPKSLQFTASGKYRIPDPDPYRPYEGMPDTLRNRLLMFVAKWSRTALDFETGKTTKPPKPAEMLDDRSLVKWETSDPNNGQGREVLRIAAELIAAAYGGAPPTVLDPFAGGGAIPLEAGRLGCQAIANDYNPVAYLILRATCEWPRKYGKPGIRPAPGRDGSPSRPQELFEDHGPTIEVKNVLVHDVEHWAKVILESAREKIGQFYPPGEDGRPVVGYLWARTAPCSNPSCRGTIPLLRGLMVCDKRDKKVALTMDVDKQDKRVRFGIAQDRAIKKTQGTMRNRGNVSCPYCEQITPVADVRVAGLAGRMDEQMVAVITEGANGKAYRPVENSDLEAFRKASAISVERPPELILPEVTAETSDDDVSQSTGIRVHLYGMKTWGSLFNPRQLLAMQTFTSCLHAALDQMKSESQEDDYRAAIGAYLGLWVSRNSMRMCTVGRWDVGRETFQTPFDGARLPMKWDYPETNPFSGVTGGFMNQADWILHVLRHESVQTPAARVIRGDAASLPLQRGSVSVVVTDPPYFDEVAYADLSDFFYVWLKRGLSQVIPEAVITPQTPKTDEATALKHRHCGNAADADKHFRAKLGAILLEARRVCVEDGIVTVVFAHQATEAWVALIDALFAADLTIDATWPIEMELKNRVRGLNSAALETCITVVCRPREIGVAASFKSVRNEIEGAVAEAVKRFWAYGFRGADLIVACYGPAVGVFGRHERVEKADGTRVEVPELLTLARTAARDAIAGDFRGDNLSTLYYVWANLYGASEQAWDDARMVVQIGGDADSGMEAERSHGIFVVDGSSCRLAILADRDDRKNLGMPSGGDPVPLIDALHRAMLFWRQEQRGELVEYLAALELAELEPFWKLAQALFEVLPRQDEDWRIINALLVERETLRTQVKRTAGREKTLFD